MDTFQLSELEGSYSIYRFPVDSDIPKEVYGNGFLSITQTDEELSIVCKKNHSLKTDHFSHDWKCLKIIGELDFSLIGIINHITNILKTAQISVFVISTYNTDYFLIQDHQFDDAIWELKKDKNIKF